jgi:PhnO protein
MRHRLTIRAATVDDIPVLTKLLAVLGYPIRPPAVRASLEALFQDRRHAVAVAELEDEAVGVLALAVRPSLSPGGWIAVLESLVVKPDRRGLGVGEALLQFAKGLAAERGVVRLEVPVADAHVRVTEPFLLGLGFESAQARTYRWSVLEAKHPRVPIVARGSVPTVS